MEQQLEQLQDQNAALVQTCQELNTELTNLRVSKNLIAGQLGKEQRKVAELTAELEPLKAEKEAAESKKSGRKTN